MTRGDLDLRGAFRSVVEALAESGLPHAFIGALAALAWGRVRATTDLDLVVVAGSDWERIVGALARRGFRRGRSIGPADPADDLPDIAVFHSPGDPSIRIDVFIAKTAFEHEVVRSARTETALGVAVRLAKPEASIIYKLLARRPKDLEDVKGIFEVRSAAGTVLDWKFLERWAQEWGIEEHLERYRKEFGPG